MIQNRDCSGIYKITINNKIYIGSAIYLHKRWKEHKNDLLGNKHCNKYLQRAWNKYKEMNIEIICVCPISCLIGMEQYYINTLRPEYNICLTAGSSKGRKTSEETKKKLSIISKNISDETRAKLSLAAKRKRKPMSEEIKLKISNAKKGCKGNIGRVCSDETKRKIKEARKHQIFSEETRKKMSEAHHNISDETRAKMSKASKGDNNPMSKKRILERELIKTNTLI